MLKTIVGGRTSTSCNCPILLEHGFTPVGQGIILRTGFWGKGGGGMENKKDCTGKGRKKKSLSEETQMTTKPQNQNYFLMLSWASSPANSILHGVRVRGWSEEPEPFSMIDPGRRLETDLIVFGKVVFFLKSSSQKRICSWSLTQSKSVNYLPEGQLHFSCLLFATRHRTECWLTFTNH